MSDLTYAVHEVRAARPAYEEADRYFRGQAKEVFASPTIRRKLEDTGLPHRFNFARRPVAAVLERIQLLSVTVAGSEEDTGWLAELARRNELHLEVPHIHRSALVFGDAYAVVWPAGDTGDGEGGEGTPGGVDIFYNSPLTTRVIYDSENPRLRRYAVKLWEPESGGVRANLYYPDRVEKWQLAQDARGKGDDEKDWEHYTAGGQWVLEHGMGEVPVFHFRTDRPYGEPVHVDAYGPQDAVTKLVAAQMSSTDYQAYPQRWAIVGATDTLGSFGGADDFDDETQAPDPGLSNLKAGPGELWELKGVQSVGQFAAADVEAFLRPLTFCIHAMAACTGTPLYYFEPVGDAPSGESLRALDMPLAAKAAHLRESFTATHQAMLRCTLRAGGRDPSGDVGVWWSPIQTINDLVGWQGINEKIKAGVPVRDALLGAGYSVEQVEAWGYAEGPEISPKVAALTTFGQAVESLAAAVTANVITAEQAQAIATVLLGGPGRAQEGR